MTPTGQAGKFEQDNEWDMRPSILLVDDELSVLQALQRGLRQRYRVIPATDGQHAIELLRAGLEIAAVMSDYHMPQVTGIDVLTVARKTHPCTPRILFTGCADQLAESGDGKKLGAQIILLKPLDAEHVAGYLNYVICGA